VLVSRCQAVYDLTEDELALAMQASLKEPATDDEVEIIETRQASGHSSSDKEQMHGKDKEVCWAVPAYQTWLVSDALANTTGSNGSGGGHNTRSPTPHLP
jgi:hypothetical protein